MNNPLAQKYNYYLNESHRLNEELKTEESYSELLENVLFELLGEEDFTKLFEYVMQGTVTQDEKVKPLSKERSERRRKRIGQIVDIGRAAAKKDDAHLQSRAAYSLLAKGGDADQNQDSRVNNVYSALKHGGKIKIHHDSPMDPVRHTADLDQRDSSLRRRKRIEYKKDDAANTF